MFLEIFFSLDVRKNRIYSRATGLLMLKSELPIANQIEEFCYSHYG